MTDPTAPGAAADSRSLYLVDGSGFIFRAFHALPMMTRADGTPVNISPRWVLRRVLELYEERGWRPIVAPELEFFLVQINKDPDYPLLPPVGRSGVARWGRQ